MDITACICYYKAVSVSMWFMVSLYISAVTMCIYRENTLFCAHCINYSMESNSMLIFVSIPEQLNSTCFVLGYSSITIYPLRLMFGLFFHHQVVLQFYEHEFVELACQCPAVVVCRCSPTQKADIVQLLKVHTDKATCAIGGLSLCVDQCIFMSRNRVKQPCFCWSLGLGSALRCCLSLSSLLVTPRMTTLCNV